LQGKDKEFPVSIPLDLKQLEQKAWRSTYEDGLWDIYYGLIVICMGLFIYRPEVGYSAANIVFLVVAMAGCYGLFAAGKRWITLPRLGQVKFGPARQKRKVTLAFWLGLIVAVQVVLVGFQLIAWGWPQVGEKLFGALQTPDYESLMVALIGALFVLPGMLLIAHFKDFPRGYYIAAMTALAVFLMIWLNQPLYTVLIGGLIVLPGVVLLVRFIQKYPVANAEGM
jgi:hypothetical protein